MNTSVMKSSFFFLFVVFSPTERENGPLLPRELQILEM